MSEVVHRRPLWKRALAWIWCIFHIRVILRRAIAGVYAAEDAKQRVATIEGWVHSLADQDENSIDGDRDFMDADRFSDADGRSIAWTDRFPDADG